MRRRVLCFVAGILITLPVYAATVYAENEQTGTATNTNNVGTVVAGTTDQNQVPSNTGTPNASNSQVAGDAAATVNSYGDLFSDMGNPLDSQAANSVSTTMAPIVASIIGFFGKVIPLAILAYTGLELACIAIPPIRAPFGATASGSAGMDGSSSGNKKVLLQVSEDCLAILKGGSGGMEGGGDSKGGGLSSMLLKYLTLRSKTIIVCLVTIGLLLTPFGYNILLTIVELIFNAITKLFAFLS